MKEVWTLIKTEKADAENTDKYIAGRVHPCNSASSKKL
jgi:hypothetical protein